MNKFSRIIFCAAALAIAPDVLAKDFWVYFGTYTNALSRGIYVARLNADTGKISSPELAVETPSPCWVAVSPDEKVIYAANNVKTFKGENTGSISAFALDAATGRLNFLNAKSSGGAGPCYVSVEASGRMLLTANYGAGSVKSFRLETDGSIGADGTLIQHTGHSVNTNRQAAPHAHFIATDPGNRFALACDLGLDRVLAYRLNPTNAALEMQFGCTQGEVPAGAGARHLAFSRNGKFIYVVNEMDCSVSQLSWDAKNGLMELQKTVSALPDGVKLQGSYTAAEILVHPSGKFLYVTLRGHDSVSVFDVNQRNGRLKLVQNVPSGGKAPRGMGIDPTGRWLFTGNQKSDNAVQFAIEEKTGKLSPTGADLKIGSPVDVKFVAAP